MDKEVIVLEAPKHTCFDHPNVPCPGCGNFDRLPEPEGPPQSEFISHPALFNWPRQNRS
jgi:hypothetical protein